MCGRVADGWVMDDELARLRFPSFGTGYLRIQVSSFYSHWVQTGEAAIWGLETQNSKLLPSQLLQHCFHLRFGVLISGALSGGNALPQHLAGFFLSPFPG